jgi:hypothetical protein
VGVAVGRAEHPLVAVAAGVAAGFTTMTANAAGAVMTLYLLAMRVEKLRFIGTSAWFFLIVNVSKVPFSAGLGLFHRRRACGWWRCSCRWCWWGRGWASC